MHLSFHALGEKVPGADPKDIESQNARADDTHPIVVISLDPNWSDASGRRPTLRGLGLALEREEHRQREARRPNGDQRGGEPRWEDGSVDHEDPWYDGRGHEYTIVDVPRSGGTWIPFKTIVDMVKEPRTWRRQVRGQLAIFSTKEREAAMDGAEDSGEMGVSEEPAIPEHFSEALTPFFEGADVGEFVESLLSATSPLAQAGSQGTVERWVWRDGIIPVDAVIEEYEFKCDIVQIEGLLEAVRETLAEADRHLVLSCEPIRCSVARREWLRWCLGPKPPGANGAGRKRGLSWWGLVSS